MPKSRKAFSTFYRGHEINVGYMHHPKGIAARVQINGGEWQYDSDIFRDSYYEACFAGIALGRRLIDREITFDASR